MKVEASVWKNCLSLLKLYYLLKFNSKIGGKLAVGMKTNNQRAPKPNAMPTVVYRDRR